MIYVPPRLLLTYHRFLTAVPTAELEPITETYVQSDEVFSMSPRWL